MAAVIETHGLHKHFGDIHAVDGLDLLVKEGEINPPTRNSLIP